MRALVDKILRAGIKLCMLTGIAFTFAACYAPAPMPEDYNEPEFQQEQQKVEMQLQKAVHQ